MKVPCLSNLWLRLWVGRLSCNIWSELAQPLLAAAVPFCSSLEDSELQMTPRLQEHRPDSIPASASGLVRVPVPLQGGCFAYLPLVPFCFVSGGLCSSSLCLITH